MAALLVSLRYRLALRHIFTSSLPVDNFRCCIHWVRWREPRLLFSNVFHFWFYAQFPSLVTSQEAGRLAILFVHRSVTRLTQWCPWPPWLPSVWLLARVCRFRSGGWLTDESLHVAVKSVSVVTAELGVGTLERRVSGSLGLLNTVCFEHC